MSYQVLARKWRPRTFREMVGQEHVLQALINALDHDRLHHAYLFSGTRGVGKTTIARILAKCLNCEVGVSSVPCNECSSCIEINEGRFVDLIEVDAASRTKVEDTRELLENVQYAPTRGRYKVYLIDEVHMLSNSSFNALLKTLEEPPPHVKFLLATTDPQKLPVTILSRCLQFNLKNMMPERIVRHLEFVLEKEQVPFEEAGLWQLARSADGSMRDALSLTDQSIAFGDGKITDADVCTMLGTIDQTLVQDVLRGLMTEDVSALLAAVAQLAEHSPDYSAALAELIATLHRIAIAQVLPEAVDNSQGDRQQIYDFAQAMGAEDVQLYYQTALLGRRDLPLVPDPRSGFEMVLLRMLAFKPQGVAQLPKRELNTVSTPDIKEEAVPHAEPVQGGEEPVKKPETAAEAVSERAKLEKNTAQNVDQKREHQGDVADPLSSESLVANEPEFKPEPELDHPALEHPATPVVEPIVEPAVIEATVTEEITTEEKRTHPSAANDSHTAEEYKVDTARFHVPVEPPVVQPQSLVIADSQKISLSELTPNNWFDVYQSIKTGGLLQSTVANCQLLQVENIAETPTLSFMLDEQQSTLYDSQHQQVLARLLGEYFGRVVNIIIRVGVVTENTPAQLIIQQRQQRLEQAKASIHNDPVVQQLQDVFDANVIEDSIVPID